MSNRPMDEWTCLMQVSHANTSQQGCLITNYFIIAFSGQKALPACEFYINWCQISIMSSGHTQISNGPLDEKKCLLDIKLKCPFVHWTNRNVHWTNRNVHWAFKCPFVHWTNRNVQWTFINVHSSIGRTEMSSGHSNVH